MKLNRLHGDSFLVRSCGSLLLGVLSLLAVLTISTPVYAWKQVGTIKVMAGPPGPPLVSTTAGAEGKEVITIRFRSFNLWEYRHLRNMYMAPSFPGCGFEGEFGDPYVPAWSKILQLAPGEKILFENAEYIWSPKEAYGRWFPAQKPQSDLMDLSQLVTNEKTYHRDGDIFQESRFSMSSPRQIWNQSYLSISLRPFSYFPLEGRIRFLQEARITLRRLNSPKKEPAAVERVVKRHAGYLVITPKRFLKNLEPFLKFKRKQHPDLAVLTLEEIGASIKNIDQAIEQAGSRGTKYFLLVGHSSILPASPYSSPWNRSRKPDCHDGDFVYRNHGQSGYPSYRVGRFPVVSESELDVVIAKTLRRWSNPETFQTYPMLIAHEEQAPGKYQGCVVEILESLVPHSKVKLTPRVILPAAESRGGLGSRKEDFYAAMKSGVGVMLYRGHGGTDFLASELLDYWGQRQQHWYEMKAAIPPVFYSVACLNGQMTNAKGERAFGLCENLLTSQTHGVSGTIGAIQPSPTTPNHTFAWNLMHYTYVEPQATLGDVFQASLMATMKYGFATDPSTEAWLWMGDLYNLYGDPELPVTNRRH
jgi:hypothetical protein